MSPNARYDFILSSIPQSIYASDIPCPQAIFLLDTTAELGYKISRYMQSYFKMTPICSLAAATSSAADGQRLSPRHGQASHAYAKTTATNAVNSTIFPSFDLGNIRIPITSIN